LRKVSGSRWRKKQAEEEKQQLEDEAHVNSRLAAVGEMAAGIAHEINNPLTGVIGFSELILERDNCRKTSEKTSWFISEGSRRVADIIKRLLTFARQTKPHKTTVDLNEIIDNTLKLRAYYLKNQQHRTHHQNLIQICPCLLWTLANYSRSLSI